MRELIEIVAAFETLVAAGSSVALATVAAVSGSSYRRPGARMLVAGDGQTWGGVSGGCLERDVIRRARMLLVGNPDATVCCYETGDDAGDIVIPAEQIDTAGEPGPSLGCGGQIEILIEPISISRPGPLPAMVAAARRRQKARIATVVRVGKVLGITETIKPGQRLFRIDDSEVSGTVGNSLLRNAMLHHLDDALVSTKGLSRCSIDGRGYADVLIEHIRPPQGLAIFGDGQDVGPLVELSKSLGWTVTVVGTRSPAGLRQRFPKADEVICLGGEEAFSSMLPLPADYAAVVMNHNLRRDVAVLRVLLNQPPAYIGILGPLRRTMRLLQATGAPPDTSRIFAPVGLDIGAETPEQIALSVVAEIQAFANGGKGGFLRDRSGPIHLLQNSSTGESVAQPRGFGSCPM
ncbi:MAG: XdhC family protein [Planctomycetota bacterium]|nr:XdhC family protein [Planctomycetota bacterium]